MERILCKLTDSKDKTRNNTQWGENITHTTNGKGGLCTNGWIHYYDSPLLAVLLNPIHGNFKNPHLWKVKVGEKTKKDNGLKFGSVSVTTIYRIELPKISTEQRIIFGILCSMAVYKNKKFTQWGKHWIDGTDRSWAAAWAAAEAAEAAARASARASARAAAKAAWAARASARAAAEAAAEASARASAWAARAAWAAAEAAARASAREAARAAWAAEWAAAEAAAEAARAAAEAAGIDLHKLALKAVSYK